MSNPIAKSPGPEIPFPDDPPLWTTLSMRDSPNDKALEIFLKASRERRDRQSMGKLALTAPPTQPVRKEFEDPTIN